jgi:hypothetical protein
MARNRRTAMTAAPTNACMTTKTVVAATTGSIEVTVRAVA